MDGQRKNPCLALMWRGDPLQPERPMNHVERSRPLVAALGDLGIETRQVVYFDENLAAARRQLMDVDGVLVWINPLQDGRDRRQVDALLREVAAAGVWVSAHPDAILKLGTKEVLHRTRKLGWGCDTDLYAAFEEFRLRFPVKLDVAGPRVLKVHRGNDGKGVFKVANAVGRKGFVDVQAASDDGVETLPLADFMARLEGAFEGGAPLIDQAFEPGIGRGMVRCYMSQDRVVGFSEQKPRGGDGPAFGMNSAKTMHGADAADYQQLRRRMEEAWTPGLQDALGLSAAQLPALWDADFLHRSHPLDPREPPFVLCEINVSSVSPFPDVAAPAIARTVARMLGR